jgi:hypothetical protein
VSARNTTSKTDDDADLRPPTRRRFSTPWDCIKYNLDKLEYWLDCRKDRARAKVYANRLRALLAKHDPDEEALLGSLGRAAIASFDREYDEEIHYAEQGIQRLIKVSQWGIACPGYDWSDVVDWMSILALLYSENGDNKKALAVAQRCKKLADKHGVDYDLNADRQLILS